MQSAAKVSLVGRQAECEVLGGCLATAAAGAPAVVVVQGEAGVGKTALVEELRGFNGLTGWRWLSGSALDLASGRLPFYLWRQAVADLLEGELVGLGDMQREAVRMFAAVVDHPQGGQGLPELWARARLFESTLMLLAEVAGPTGLVLVLEDLHWADQSSLDLLVFVLARLRRQRALIVLTHREVSPEHELSGCLADLRRDPRVTWLSLTGLPSQELAELLTGRTGQQYSAELVAWYQQVSGGNPFYALELAAAGARPPALPETVRDLVLVGLRRLSDDGRVLVEAAAVLGLGADSASLGDVSALDAAVLDAAVTEVCGARLLTPDAASGELRLRHDIVRRAVYESLPVNRRQRLHQRAASALGQAVPEPDWTAARAGAIAEHWYRAHQWAEAFDSSIAAGRRAAATLAYPEAAQHFTRALDIPAPAGTAGDRVDLLAEAAEAYRWAGQTERACELIRQSLSEAPVEDGGRRAGLLERLGRYLYDSGQGAEGRLVYNQALICLKDSGPSPVRAQVLAALASVASLEGHYKTAIDLSTQARSAARAAKAPVQESFALVPLGCSLALSGAPDDGEQVLRDARRLSEQAGDIEGVLRAAGALAFILQADDRDQQALDVCLDGLALARAHGVEDTAGAVLHVNAVDALILLGRWQEADSLAQAGLSRGGIDRTTSVLLTARGQVAVGQGRFPQAQEYLERALISCADLHEPHIRVPVHVALADLHAWQGQTDQAIEQVLLGLQLLEGTEESGLTGNLLQVGLRAQADAATIKRLGDPGPARSPALDLAAQRYTDDANAEESLGKAHRRACRLSLDAERSRRDGKDQASTWEQCAQAWASVVRPYLEAYALWRATEAWLIQRDRHRATQSAQRADLLATQLGAGPLRHELQALASRARLPLLLTDASPPPDAPQGPAVEQGHGLTPRELEVLRLLAQGSTNRQVARALFISERTAAVHVSHILGKLNASSRTEAAAVAHRLGLLL